MVSIIASMNDLKQLKLLLPFTGISLTVYSLILRKLAALKYLKKLTLNLKQSDDNTSSSNGGSKSDIKDDSPTACKNSLIIVPKLFILGYQK
jgi:hypothetical protein